MDEEEESTNNEPLTLEGEETQSIEYVLEERLCGNPRGGRSPSVGDQSMEGVYRTVEAEEGLGMPQGSFCLLYTSPSPRDRG